MRACACDPPRPNPSPHKTSCVRCGFRVFPKPPPPPIVHHCSRCTTDLPPGHSGGMLYLLDAGVTREMTRYCEPCTLRIMQLGAQMA